MKCVREVRTVRMTVVLGIEGNGQRCDNCIASWPLQVILELLALAPIIAIAMHFNPTLALWGEGETAAIRIGTVSGARTYRNGLT